MVYVLGAADADDVFLQKQIEYLNKAIIRTRTRTRTRTHNCSPAWQ